MGKLFNIRHILGLSVLSLLLFLAFLVVRNYQGRSPEEAMDALPAQVDLSMEKVRYTESREGRRRWTLEADRADYSRSRDISQVENVFITFFDPEGQEDVTLRARQGQIEVEKGWVEVWGDVEFKSSQGATYRSERMTYQDRERLILTDSPVRLEVQGMEILGRGMRIDLATQRAEILSDVSATILPGQVQRREG